MAADGWQRLIDGLRSGDQHVVQEFCRLYAGPLELLAEQRLANRLRRRVGPEDVVQSVCRTFLRRMRAGEFQLPDSESLWRLLCTITLVKIREQARLHQRQKRDLSREVPIASLAAHEEGAQGEFEAAAPTPDQAAEFADQFEQLIGTLDDEESRLVQLKLEQYTNDEAAVHLGCSERTVRRILKRVQERLKRTFGAG
jgi:RNA polymerase sigma-70 factor, ECF subfamily